ncbi:hypothetical protein DAPPUDRAFT_107537 [Daphnia pulex]|uniref:Uncharacterized protein n=1 Tax=Daphnia pulex TaxID=6669 RepID=E9GXF7_DAPPU|nr:hypothetical protein DAPPUDRAFT_107537 [Daphnia pulex]|eukprot:EFX75863.1 hypothetical protein DAPPUDRAFT_107537 [Daphnia pulex]
MGKIEVERFMKLRSVANVAKDFFVIVHIERLSSATAIAVREGVDRVLPENQCKLLLLAQHHHRFLSTKALGARLGLVFDRLIEINVTADQLRQFFSIILPNAVNLHFFPSKFSSCGERKQAM